MTADARRDSGFTLVELLTVIVILGVLAAIAIPTYLNQREKGFRATALSDARAILAAQATVLADEDAGTYTDDVAELRQAGYNRSPQLEQPVIRLAGGDYLACLKHPAMGEWLILDSGSQETNWSETNACA